MADKVIQGGTNKSDFSIDNLAPNNYLTIMWNNQDTKTKVQTLSVDMETYNEMFEMMHNSTQNVLSGGIYKVINNKYLNIGSVAKYFAQTTFDSYGARQAVNGIINVLQDGKIQNDDVLNAVLYYSGDILSDVAKDYGISDVNPLIQQLAGQNILNNFNGLGFFESFCNKTQDWTNKSEAELNERMLTLPYSEDDITKEYSGILLGITESDTHSIDIDIPRKRTESGYNYTSHVIVNPFKKDLKLKLTNKFITGIYNQATEVDSIEATRDLIESIANSKMRFDIYIRLSDKKYRCYPNLMFSSLSFDKNSSTGMSYDFTCTIEPVEEYIPKTYIFTPPNSTCNIKNNKSTATNNSRTAGGNTNPAQKPVVNPSKSDANIKQVKENFKKYMQIPCPSNLKTEKLIKMTIDETEKYLKNSGNSYYKNILKKLHSSVKLTSKEKDDLKKITSTISSKTTFMYGGEIRAKKSYIYSKPINWFPSFPH